MCVTVGFSIQRISAQRGIGAMPEVARHLVESVIETSTRLPEVEASDSVVRGWSGRKNVVY